mgnify:CR=1 FL=1
MDRDNKTMPPNIILITTDQQRWDFYDNRTVRSLRTPNLQRLMREGATLTNATSNCPICIPTRFTWCHGLYASQGAARLLRNCHDWPHDLPGMPQALQGAGYQTAIIGKLHAHEGLWHRDLCDTEYVQSTRDRGFDHVFEVCGKSLAFWFDCNWTRHLERRGLLDDYRRDLAVRSGQISGEDARGDYGPGILSTEESMDGFIGRNVCEWLGERRPGAPFFLHASFCGPHGPLDPPEEFAERYDPAEMPPPEGVDDAEEIRRWKRLRALYCAQVELIDVQIGRLLQTLEDQGLLEDTAIVFGTDHGDMLGHLGKSGKGPAYDTSCRTPYVVWWPGRVPAGQTLTGPVEAVDLPATIMDIAGLGSDPAAHIPYSPGRSFLPYAAGESGPPREWAYAEWGGGEDAWRMCREPDWKYVVSPSGDQLFNLAEDPWETVNRVDDPALRERISRMRRRVIESMLQTVTPDTIPQRPRDDWWLKGEDNA